MATLADCYGSSFLEPGGGGATFRFLLIADGGESPDCRRTSPGLKPVISYQAFAARLKSCPFKTRLSLRGVRREFDEICSDHCRGCVSGGDLLRGLLCPDQCRLAGLQRRGGWGPL